jgi:hypothetical protein
MNRKIHTKIRLDTFIIFLVSIILAIVHARKNIVLSWKYIRTTNLGLRLKK